ncbi:MAG: hypothetical protein CMJ46_09870 [Planctomyces sp.]|nr:hypothetical protein [Planctomyces sp.]
MALKSMILRQIVLFSVVSIFVFTHAVYAQGVVPGQGSVVPNIGDDFEDESWTYTYNFPKSSSNIDEQVRRPNGFSSNRRVLESDYRGTPDLVKRVPTPEGGLPGSTGALLMQTQIAGIPGRLSMEMQQDDLVLNPRGIPGNALWLQKNPSFVVRVYVPPFDEFEDRTGSTFGIRADCHTLVDEKKGFGIFRKKSRKMEPYWPGFFIQFNSKTDGRNEEDSAHILIRCDQYGRDIAGPKITQPGWWTFGMSFTPDGMVHYYAHEGIHDLTAADHLLSSFPYGYKCEGFHSSFFNITTFDDGKTWSTKWIIDDPTFYYADGPARMATGNLGRKIR